MLLCLAGMDPPALERRAAPRGILPSTPFQGNHRSPLEDTGSLGPGSILASPALCSPEVTLRHRRCPAASVPCPRHWQRGDGWGEATCCLRAPEPVPAEARPAPSALLQEAGAGLARSQAPSRSPVALCPNRSRWGTRGGRLKSKSLGTWGGRSGV